METKMFEATNKQKNVSMAINGNIANLRRWHSELREHNTRLQKEENVGISVHVDQRNERRRKRIRSQLQT